MADVPRLELILARHREADVVGSIYAAREAWRSINPPREVWQTVSGLRIATSRTPRSSRRLTSPTPELEKEIESLIAIGAVEEVFTRPEVVTPIFGVPKTHEEAIRLIHDLRLVNETLETRKFTMKGLYELETAITRGDFMIAVDMRKGYYQVLVHPEDRGKLGFRWRDKFFRFKVMPFGLSTAPRAYIEMVRFIATWIRREFDVKLVAYLDDWLILHADKEYLTNITPQILQVLFNFGLIVGPDKCSLIPAQTMVFLGVEVYSDTMTFRLTETKRQAYSQMVARVLKDLRSLTRTWASLAGKLGFCRVVVGDAAMVRIRSILKQVNSAKREDSARIMRQSIYSGCLKDLEWWKECLETQPQRQFAHIEHNVRMETDASHEALASVIFVEKEEPVRWVQATRALGHLHITSLETLAISRAIMANKDLLKGRKLRILTDSTVAAKWVRTSGMTVCQLVETELKELHDWLRDTQTSLVTYHKAGAWNWTADRLSRPTTFKPLEWDTPQQLLLMAAARWGSLEGDLFKPPGVVIMYLYYILRDVYKRELS